MHWSFERDVRRVAEMMDCSVTTVRRRLSEGPPVFRGLLSPYSHEERKDRNKQIIKMYLAGVPVAELADKFRLSRQRVWQVLGPRESRPPRRKRRLQPYRQSH
jgi:DNA invertase Pin-like site-specific DNA recombinase